jgi:hypothetical protein
VEKKISQNSRLLFYNTLSQQQWHPSNQTTLHLQTLLKGIESVIQEPEEELNPSLNVVSPNQPRNLFGNRQLPSLPSYLTHFVARSTNSVNLDEVREEMEDTCLADDDDSVEEAVEASLLTESLVECFQDRVDDDSVFSSDAN